jgi:co-chaperonin GroES (HSP10)
MVMKWFDKWFVRKCKWAWDNKHLAYEDREYVTSGSPVAVSDDPHNLNDGLRINIKKVVGGSLVTFRTYDRRKDQNEDKTYIITSDQDFNIELGKIITMESMRQS